MGDVLSDDPIPAEIDQEKLLAAVDAFFTDGAMTASFVVTYKGQVIAERYGDGIDMHTPLESWSMGKSLSATLMGVLIEQGEYELDQPAPIPEWQEKATPDGQSESRTSCACRAGCAAATWATRTGIPS